jgi:23S rRNA (adenine2503-C2)-methyltransferase
MSVVRNNLVGLDLESLQSMLQADGQAKFRATQIVQWVHQHGVLDVSKMTNLSKSLQQYLLDNYEISVPKIIYQRAAQDATVKFLLQLEGGGAVETVYIPDKTRATVCISSQVGCALNCNFCSTGKEGFHRNLTAAEIIGQLWQVCNYLRNNANDSSPKVSNVVMMGMGEPLLNYEPVLAAMKLMLEDNAYGLSKYKVTLSTAGIVPAMQRLKKDIPVALAVSLHAPNDELRTKIMPINRKYPIADLMAVCRDYYAGQPKRHVTFEYILLRGVNDNLEQAKELAQLLQGIACKINLIPFNSYSGCSYNTSDEQRIASFQQYLMSAGFNTRVRRRRGDDVDAACGQLVGQVMDKTGRNDRWKRTGEIVPRRHLES